MPKRGSHPAREWSPWDKAFWTSFGLLCSAIFLLVCTAVFPSPSEVINSPYPGFEAWVKFLDALEKVDTIHQAVTFVLSLITIVTGIVSGILVRMFQRLLEWLFK